VERSLARRAADDGGPCAAGVRYRDAVSPDAPYDGARRVLGRRGESGELRYWIVHAPSRPRPLGAAGLS